MGRSIGYENYRTMDEKMKKNEELQSRREFFKKAAKGALPILGAVLLANVPIVSKAVENNPSGCNYACSVGCGSGCTGMCSYDCSSSCARLCNSCQTGCQGGCKYTCTATCASGCHIQCYAYSS